MIRLHVFCVVDHARYPAALIKAATSLLNNVSNSAIALPSLDQGLVVIINTMIYIGMRRDLVKQPPPMAALTGNNFHADGADVYIHWTKLLEAFISVMIQESRNDSPAFWYRICWGLWAMSRNSEPYTGSYDALIPTMHKSPRLSGILSRLLTNGASDLLHFYASLLAYQGLTLCYSDKERGDLKTLHAVSDMYLNSFSIIIGTFRLYISSTQLQEPLTSVFTLMVNLWYRAFLTVSTTDGLPDPRVGKFVEFLASIAENPGPEIGRKFFQLAADQAVSRITRHYLLVERDRLMQKLGHRDEKQKTDDKTLICADEKSDTNVNVAEISPPLPQLTSAAPADAPVPIYGLEEAAMNEKGMPEPPSDSCDAMQMDLITADVGDHGVEIARELISTLVLLNDLTKKVRTAPDLEQPELQIPQR